MFTLFNNLSWSTSVIWCFYINIHIQNVILIHAYAYTKKVKVLTEGNIISLKDNCNASEFDIKKNKEHLTFLLNDINNRHYMWFSSSLNSYTLQIIENKLTVVFNLRN